MKKYNLSLMITNENGEFVLDKKVNTNSKKYALKKLDYDNTLQYYYFKIKRLYDNNKKRFLTDYEEYIFYLEGGI